MRCFLLPLGPPACAPALRLATERSCPVKVFILLGQSNMVGEAQKDGDQNRSLAHAVLTDKKYPYLWDEAID